jgi:hypothetical protein
MKNFVSLRRGVGCFTHRNFFIMLARFPRQHREVGDDETADA